MNLLIKGLAVVLALFGIGLVISGVLPTLGILFLIEGGVLVTLIEKKNKAGAST